MAAPYAPVFMYIDGSWTAGSGGVSEPVLNPATDEILGHVPHASTADLDQALEAANRGFKVWRDTPMEARTRILHKAAALLRQRAAAVAETMTLEQGKPLGEAMGEVMRVAGAIEWDAEEGRRAYGRIIPLDRTTQLSVLRQPIGPVAAFTPWNFPVGSPNRKISAALAAGCSIVIKASEEVPGTACALVRCYEEAGVPPGVLNLVFGVPAKISAHLIASPIIRFVAFTGSVPVGKHLAALAGSHMKPHIMELGGHAPVIVCADADPVAAARGAAAGKFINAGQVCTSASRFIVHESLYERFVQTFAAVAAETVVGNGLDKATKMGPLANVRRLEATQALVADALAHRATLVYGGERIGTRGNFFLPTVLGEVPTQARIMNVEPFGPVAPIVRFQRLDEAIDLANALPYGLAAYAYTQSAAVAEEITHRLEAGIISINHVGGSIHEAPSGGWKDSGYGREGGSEGLDGYLVTKRVSHKLR
jgi:succinate-semialdehyde dehydrogenase / glutarate-semialdehyde dehydrogenase